MRRPALLALLLALPSVLAACTTPTLAHVVEDGVPVPKGEPVRVVVTSPTEGPLDATAGMDLPEDARVETPPATEAVVDTADATVTLHEESTFQIGEEEASTDAGTIFVDAKDSMDVSTEEEVWGVEGTEFVIETRRDGVTVTVLEGKVVGRSRRGAFAPVTLTASMQARVRDHAAVERRRIAPEEFNAYVERQNVVLRTIGRDVERLVPHVAGQPEEIAAGRIRRAGLTPAIEPTIEADVPLGAVSRQDPEAGNRLDPGGTVRLHVRVEPVIVPDLSGASAAAAEGRVKERGLEFGVSSETLAVGVPSERVASQTPPAGTPVAPGSTVTVAVERPGAAVPDLRGARAPAVDAALAKAGLARGPTTQEPSADVAAGLVLDLSPDPGTVVAPGTAVSVTLSSGPASVTVPDVSGWSKEKAMARMQKLGLVPQYAAGDHPDGKIQTTQPKAGTVVQQGTKVILWDSVVF